ncbi:MAG: YeeE/YedE thiosulfate transporter family protein [Enterobacterales bacterium]|nr:YeeE/YedE thiosulfate transporter family protein [Enterobacterales bacterium]
MQDFEIIKPLLGGMVIGLSAALLMLARGRIAGISGIIEGVLRPKSGEIAWRVLFLCGIICGGLIFSFIMPERFVVEINRTTWMVALAGLLVGIGTHIGCGCTSGHGICGISRFSVRSLVAVPTFMLTGATVVWVVNLYIA